MPSVNPVPPAEPRIQPANKQQAPSGDPFAEMLDSATNKRPVREQARAERSSKQEQPTAPASRDKIRADALERDEQPKGEAGGVSRAESKPAEATAKPDADASDEVASSAKPELDTDGETGDVAATAPDVTVVAAAETGAEAPQIAVEPTAETAVPSYAAPTTTGSTTVVAEGKVPAAVQPADAKTAPAVEAAPTVEAAPAVANADPASEQVPAVSAPRTAAATEAAAEDAAVDAPKPASDVASNTRQAAPDSTATRQTPSASAGNTATADATPTAVEGADSQPAQLQNGTPQTKAQETATPRPAESAPTPAQADSTAPKAQPSVTQTAPVPEPVRALNASFDQRINIANGTEVKPTPINIPAVAVEIASRMKDGLRRFDIRLDPPELGRVDVRLEVDRSGNVSTKLTVDRPETLDLMQRDARALERALQQAGLKTDEGGLEFSLRQHADERFAQGQGHSGRGDLHADLTAHEGGESTEAVVQGYYRAAASARGGVDITV